MNNPNLSSSCVIKQILQKVCISIKSSFRANKPNVSSLCVYKQILLKVIRST